MRTTKIPAAINNILNNSVKEIVTNMEEINKKYEEEIDILVGLKTSGLFNELLRNHIRNKSQALLLRNKINEFENVNKLISEKCLTEFIEIMYIPLQFGLPDSKAQSPIAVDKSIYTKESQRKF